MHAAYGQLQQGLGHAGLVIAPEKVQSQSPFQYLGHMLYSKEIKPPPKLEIRKESSQTLNDFQSYWEIIQYLLPYLKVSTGDL